MKISVGEVCEKLEKINNILFHVEINHGINQYYVDEVKELLESYRSMLLGADVNI